MDDDWGGSPLEIPMFFFPENPMNIDDEIGGRPAQETSSHMELAKKSWGPLVFMDGLVENAWIIGTPHGLGTSI